MRRGITRGIAALTAAAALVAGAPGTGSAQPQSLRAFAIVGDGTLMATFTTDRPQVLDWVREVVGLDGDQFLIGIDFRVHDGLMYGVGSSGGVYTIKTPPDTEDVEVTKVSQLGVALYGTNFGVDFNPAVDRLRVVSDNGQNLRHDLGTGTTVEDTVLTTPPATGPTRGVTAAAYTNDDRDPTTATTLFDLNTTTDQVVIQAPANNGTLSPTGSLGVDAGANAGFDIYSDLTNGKTTSVTGFAALKVGTSAMFYTVNLFTGATTSVGKFPLSVTDVAVALEKE